MSHFHVYQKPLCGKSIGVVFGSFAPLHQGHLDLIMRAKRENDGGCLVIVCGYDGDKGEPIMPHAKRYRYVREYFANDDLVAVYSINDSELGIAAYPDGWTPWLEEVQKIWDKAIQFSDDQAYPHPRWYVGDQNYYNDLLMRKQDAVLVDRYTNNPICATMIRQNPVKHWQKIAYPFRRVFSHNILICGTASEGKTTLVQDLGKYFNAPYSWEWPRDYMAESCVADWELDGADYMAFLEGQYNLNKKLINSRANQGIFFADTDSMVTRMYAEYYAKDPTCALTQAEFEKVAVMADELTRKSHWDKIFVLPPNGVFVDDHSRFMAHSGMKERGELFEILMRNIRDAGMENKTTILYGDYYQKFLTVSNYVKEIMNR